MQIILTIDNTAKDGGVFYCIACNISLFESYIYSNTADFGGVLMIESSGYALIDSCDIK